MTIKITIEGGPNEGKTTLALLIADVLMRVGLGVHVEDADVEAEDQRSDASLQERRIDALALRGTIVDIETSPPKATTVKPRGEAG